MQTKEIIIKSKEFLGKNVSDISSDELEELGKLIENHSDLYYNKEKPVISDTEYDFLYKLLQSVEENFGIIEKVSEKVGAGLKESSFEKVKHSRPMISLDNTYNEDELNDFNKRVRKLANLPLEVKGVPEEGGGGISYTIEFKFDGLGVELIYENGKLVQGITRGNGVEGEDITENVKQIENIPKNISYKDKLEVRGEVIMPISAFKELNKQRIANGEQAFSNPRNAASGSLRQLDNKITKERKLQFFGYDLANNFEFAEKEGVKSYYELIQHIDNLGFETSSYFEECRDIGELIHKIDNFGDLKKKLDFEIDGLVLKVNTIEIWKKVGSTEHHPRYAIAYKFPAELLTTQIISVEHSVGRTGTITPVANLEPVNIGGVTVKRATLHNYDEIEKLDIKIGDSIFIKRAGEVIPKVVSVIKDARSGTEQEIEIPTECPSCGTRVEKDDEKVRYYCPNHNLCPDQLKERLSYSVGKQGFNIDGLGEKQVELFLEKGFISNIVDVFGLKKYRDQILALEGFQEKSVNNLIDSINKARNIDISVFITALSIPGVGKKTARELSKLFTCKEHILDFPYSIEDLEELNDIGIETAHSVYDYFNDKNNIELLEGLLKELDILYYIEKNNNTHGFFIGKKVCITGSFEGYKRDALAKMLESNGGEFMNNVSKKTDYLLAGDKVGSKLKKANDLGVQVIDIDGFFMLLKV